MALSAPVAETPPLSPPFVLSCEYYALYNLYCAQKEHRKNGDQTLFLVLIYLSMGNLHSLINPLACTQLLIRVCWEPVPGP
ncbi:rCG34438 [Rattus norvegicus]|uniref:RCG34438 n=1 Tax=Rattus norvegicus TaxID=10116 RepID=A6HHI6_RAT|nr:rCG34438 [Rattus norvegicus]